MVDRSHSPEHNPFVAPPPPPKAMYKFSPSYDPPIAPIPPLISVIFFLATSRASAEDTSGCSSKDLALI